jgi:hypothetical protein
MFGAFIRAALAFAAGMLASTLLKSVVGDELLTPIANNLGKSSLVYESLNGIVVYFPLIVGLTLALGLVARGVTESRAAR